MNNYRFTPKQMRERAIQFQGDADLLKAIIHRADAFMDELASAPMGVATDTCMESYHQLKPDMMRAENFFRVMSCALDSSANLIDMDDNGCACAAFNIEEHSKDGDPFYTQFKE